MTFLLWVVCAAVFYVWQSSGWVPGPVGWVACVVLVVAALVVVAREADRG